MDTSIISHLYAEDKPDWRAITEELYSDTIPSNAYNFFISDVVLGEIKRTNNSELRDKLIKAATIPAIKLITYSSDEAGVLAEKYIEQGALPPTSLDDALHVAISTICDVDILLSWNYKHLSNIEREIKIQSVNLNQGYTHPIRITNPLEVFHARE